MKPTLLVILLLIFTTACSDENKSVDSDKKREKPKVQQLSKLEDESVGDFIKRKYSKLIFVCSLEHSTLASEGSVDQDPKVYDFLTWNLLADYSVVRNQEVEFDLDNMSMVIQFNLQSGLKKTLLHSVITKESVTEYKLEEAFQLSGSYNSETIWTVDGKVVGVVSAEQNVNLYDRVPSTLEDFQLGSGNGLSVSVDCLIDAEARPGFEGQFEVTKK